MGQIQCAGVMGCDILLLLERIACCGVVRLEVDSDTDVEVDVVVLLLLLVDQAVYAGFTVKFNVTTSLIPLI